MEYIIFGVIALVVLVTLVRAINRPDGRQTYAPPNIKHDPCPEGSCSTGYSTGQQQRQLGMHEHDGWVQRQRDAATDAHHSHEQAQIAQRSGTWSLPYNPHVEYEVLTPGESQQVPQLGSGEQTGEWVKIGDHSWTRPEYVERGRR